MKIPTLETERLVLRPHTPEDFPAVLAIWSDPDVVRLMAMPPMKEEDAWAKFLRTFGAWQVNGFGMWAVVEKETGWFIGEVGFIRARRDMEPSIDDHPEMGWAFSPSVHGKGYAGEAVAAALAWGEEHIGRVRYVAIIAPENEPSLRLAGKFGFVEALRTTYKDHPTIVLFRD